MNFLQEIFADFDLKDIFIDKQEPKAINPTPELILGYSLYPEQNNWLTFCFAHDHKQVKMLLGARGYGKTEVITKYGVIKTLVEGNFKQSNNLLNGNITLNNNLSLNSSQERINNQLNNNQETGSKLTKSSQQVVNSSQTNSNNNSQASANATKDKLGQTTANPTFIIITRTLKRSRAILYSIASSLKELNIAAKYNSEEIRLKANLTKEANILVTTLSAGDLRGHHVDYVIFDDPVISQDEKSEVERENAKLVFRESLNIAKRVIVLGQPVHKQDLYSMLKEAEVDTRNSFYNENEIPELNYNLTELRKTTIEREIQRNFYNTLIDEGLYPFSNIAVAEFEFKGATIASIDPSFMGEDAIGLAIGIKAEGAYEVTNRDGIVETKTGEFYKVIANKLDGDIYHQAKDIIKLLQHFKVYRCYIESNDNGGALRYFKSLSNPSGISFLGFKETVNKEIRIKSRIGSVKDKIILHSQSSVVEITDWNETARHDDCIDALASLINFLNNNKEKVKVTRGY